MYESVFDSEHLSSDLCFSSLFAAILPYFFFLSFYLNCNVFFFIRNKHTKRPDKTNCMAKMIKKVLIYFLRFSSIV